MKRTRRFIALFIAMVMVASMLLSGLALADEPETGSDGYALKGASISADGFKFSGEWIPECHYFGRSCYLDLGPDGTDVLLSTFAPIDGFADALYTDEDCSVPLTGEIEPGTEYYVSFLLMNISELNDSGPVDIDFDSIDPDKCSADINGYDTQFVKAVKTKHADVLGTYDAVRLIFSVTVDEEEPIRHTVSFDLNGGTPEEIKTETIRQGESISDLGYFVFYDWNAPEGKVLSGYSIDDIFYTPEEAQDYLIWKDITIVFEWTDGTHTVTYDLNGGTPDNMPQEIFDHGDTLDMGGFLVFGGWQPPVGMILNGFLIDGRYYTKQEGYAYEITSDVTVKFIWADDPSIHTVVYDLNGGTPDNMPEEHVNDGTTFGEVGFLIFGGWQPPQGKVLAGFMINGELYSKEESSEYVFTGDTTIVFQWENASAVHTVTYDLNGGTPANPVTEQVAHGSSFSDISFLIFGSWKAPEGKRLAGFEIGGTFYTGAEAQDYVFTDDVTVVFIWEDDPATHVVSYDLNGGTPSTYMPQEIVADGSYFSDISFLIFGGWKAPEGKILSAFEIDGVVYSTAEAGEYVFTGDVTVKFLWEDADSVYTITYDLNGGTPDNLPQEEVAAGSTLNDVSFLIFGSWDPPYGMILDGFSIDGEDYDLHSAYDVVFPGDVTVKFLWADDPSIHTVIYDLNGGTPDNIPEEYVEDGSTFGEVSFLIFGDWHAPEGKELAGFEIGGTFYTGAEAQEYVFTGDVTVVFQWKDSVVMHTVTYDLNGGTPTGPVTDTVPDGEELNGTGFLVFGGWQPPEGKKLAGFMIDGEFIKNEPGFSYIFTKDTTVVFQWEDAVVMHTVTYDLNGGTPESLVTDHVPDGEELNGTGFLVFGGWQPPAGKSLVGFMIDGVFVKYEPGYSYKITKDVTVVFMWDLPEYSLNGIEFSADGFEFDTAWHMIYDWSDFYLDADPVGRVCVSDSPAYTARIGSLCVDSECETVYDDDVLESDTKYYFTVEILEYLPEEMGTADFLSFSPDNCSADIYGFNAEIVKVESKELFDYMLGTCDGLRIVFSIETDPAAQTEFPIWVGGKRVTVRNLSDILGNGSGSASYTPSTNTLNLKNFNYEGTGYLTLIGGYDSGAGIYAEGDLNIELFYDNSIVMSPLETYIASAGILVRDGDLTVTGDGTLSITSASGTNLDSTFGIAVFSEEGNEGAAVGGNIFIKDTEIFVTGGTVISKTQNVSDGSWSYTGGYDSHAVAATGKITIDGSKVTVSGGESGYNSYGLYSSDNAVVIIGGSSVEAASAWTLDDASAAILSGKGSVRITDSTVKASVADTQNDSLGIRAYNGKIDISGSNVTVGLGDGYMIRGIDSGFGGISVNDSTVDITTGHAVAETNASIAGISVHDSNGLEFINSTVTFTSGTAKSENIGILAGDGDIVIDGSDVTVEPGSAAGGNVIGIRTGNQSTTVTNGSKLTVNAGGSADTDKCGGYISAGYLYIEDGSIVSITAGNAIDECIGLNVEFDLTVTDGELDVLSGNSSEGYSFGAIFGNLDAKESSLSIAAGSAETMVMGIGGYYGMALDNSSVTVTTGNSGDENYGINIMEKDITVSGGSELNVTTGDGVYSVQGIYSDPEAVGDDAINIEIENSSVTVVTGNVGESTTGGSVPSNGIYTKGSVTLKSGELTLTQGGSPYHSYYGIQTDLLTVDENSVLTVTQSQNGGPLAQIVGVLSLKAPVIDGQAYISAGAYGTDPEGGDSGSSVGLCTAVDEFTVGGLLEARGHTAAISGSQDGNGGAIVLKAADISVGSDYSGSDAAPVEKTGTMAEIELTNDHKYAITVNTDSSYRVEVTDGSADKPFAAPGDTVTVTADDKEGFIFDKWQRVSGIVKFDDPTASTAHFVMPSSDVAVKAIYKEDKAFSISVTNGTSDKASARLGETVTVTAYKISGSEFTEWTVLSGDIELDDPASETARFTMPYEDVTLKAEYKEITYAVTVTGGTADKETARPGETVTVSADEKDGYTFSGWTVISGDVELDDSGAEETFFTMPASDVELEAVFTEDPAEPGGDDTVYYGINAPEAENGTVSVSPSRAGEGDKVTVTLSPDEGYEADSVTVKDSNGNVIEVTENPDGTYTFTMPAGKVTVEAKFKEKTPSASGRRFKDVAPEDWFNQSVEYVADKGLMKGIGNDLFDPQGFMSRAMLVTILYRLEGKPAVTEENPFNDVPEGEWYTDAVIWASSKGIVKGYGNGSFGPADFVTRSQFAVILYRYEQYKGGGFSGTWYFPLDFDDVNEISDWADEALHWCVMHGIIKGRTERTIVPSGTATRAEGATILMRFLEAE